MRFNSEGHALMGTDQVVSIDGVPVVPGTAFGWIDEDRVLCRRLADSALCQYDLRDRSVMVLNPRGANEAAAGGGQWAAWLAGVGLYTSDGFALPDAGLLDVGSDGDLAYVPSRQLGVGYQILSRATPGQRYLDTAAMVSDFRCTGALGAYWRTAGGQLRTNFGWPVLDILGEQIDRPVLLVVRGTKSVLYASAVGDLRWRPVDSPMGVIVAADTIGRYYNHDAIVEPDGTILVGWSIGQGERPTELRTMVLDVLTMPRVDFRLSPHPPIPEVPPAPRYYDLGWWKDPSGQGPGTCHHRDGAGLLRMDGSLIANNLDPEGAMWLLPSGTIVPGLTPAEMFMTDPLPDSVAAVKARLATAMARIGGAPCLVTLQADSRVGAQGPRWSDAQLATLVFSYPALIALHANVLAVVLFARDRAGGLVDHAWMTPFYERWIASLPTRENDMPRNLPVLTPTKDLTAPFREAGQELDLTDTGNPQLGTRIRVINDPVKGLRVAVSYANTAEGSTGKRRPI